MHESAKKFNIITNTSPFMLSDALAGLGFFFFVYILLEKGLCFSPGAVMLMQSSHLEAKLLDKNLQSEKK